jgi:hypothetical protein
MSLHLKLKNNYMRKYFLFGLLALGLIALGPTESKADEGFSIHIGPRYQQTDLITMTPGATAIIVTLMNIGGTDGIIGIITIRIDVRINLAGQEHPSTSGMAVQVCECREQQV